jgi:hypothetical protein
MCVSSTCLLWIYVDLVKDYCILTSLAHIRHCNDTAVRNSTTKTISSFAKTSGNSVGPLKTNSLTTVAVLSTFGFVAISAMFIGLFVIHKRSSAGGGPFPLARHQDRVLFEEFHSEDALDSELSVCGSSDLESSKSSGQPSVALE